MKRCGEVGTCHDRASAAARRSWPLRWGDGAVVVVERGPCEGEAAAAGAAGHGPYVEGDVVVANQRGRAEVLSLTKTGAAASAAALGHGPGAARGEIAQLPTSTDGEMCHHWRGATERSTPAIVGGGRVERAPASIGGGRVLAQRSSASWPPAHAQPAFSSSE